MELLLPAACAGCACPGHLLCPMCRQELTSPPQRVATTVDPGVPVWSLGPYSAVRRSVIVAMKERNNRAVRPLIGAVLGAGVRHLCARGELPEEAVLVPAPTRARAARRRGGDHVTALCRASGWPLARLLSYPGAQVVDSVGLGAVERQHNLLGRVQVSATARFGDPPLVLIDDIVTTGATLAASVAALAAAGFSLAGALTLASA